MTFKTEYEKFKHDKLNEDFDTYMDAAKREKVDIPFWQKAYSVIDPLSVNVVPEEKKKIIALVFFGFEDFHSFPSVIESKFLVGYYGWDELVCDYVFTSEEGSMFAFKSGKTPKTIVRMFWNYLDELRVKVKEGKRDEIHS